MSEPAAKSNPYYAWDRDSPGWLHRCVAEKDDILPRDVARVLEKNPDLLADDVVRDLTIRFLRGQIKGRRGRKRGPSRILLEWNLLMRFLELEMDHKPVRRKGTSPSAQAPSAMERIHEIVAMEFKVGGSQNVRNLLSRIKSGKNLRVDRRTP